VRSSRRVFAGVYTVVAPHEPTVLDGNDAVGDPFDQQVVVADQQDGGAVVVPQPVDRLEQLVAVCGVEDGGDLATDQDGWATMCSFGVSSK
jgi:hypothetical protein